MRICCFPNCAYLSETSRMIAVYKKLVARGEDPIMATHGGTYEFLLADEGVHYHIVEPHMSDERSRQFVAKNRMDGGLIVLRKGFYETDELREHVRAEIEFFKQNDVGVTLTGFTLSNALSTRSVGIPYVVTHLASMVPPVFERNMHRWPMNFENFVTRLIPGRVKTKRINWKGMRVGFFIKEFNIIAEELGISPFRGFVQLMMGDLTCVTDSPEILTIPREEMDSWTPAEPELYNREYRLKYVGAIFARLFGEVPDDVKTFLECDKPRVYVALTSSRPDYVLSVYNTLRRMDVKVVFCSTIHSTEFEVSPDILVKDHLPSHRVMPLVDLAVIHGGQGSVQTAIASGIPVVGFPLHGEQQLNLQTVERHGAGVCLPLKALTRGGLRKQIKKVLTDESFKSNMERLKSFQDRYDGARNTATVLRELAQQCSRESKRNGSSCT